jgi:hypothetical protein
MDLVKVDMALAVMVDILDTVELADTAADLLKDSTPMGQELGEESVILLPGVRVTQDWDLILICTDSSNLIRVIAAMVHGPRMNTGFLDK